MRRAPFVTAGGSKKKAAEAAFSVVDAGAGGPVHCRAFRRLARRQAFAAAFAAGAFAFTAGAFGAAAGFGSAGFAAGGFAA